jgi:hypothetical protein
MNDFNPKLTFEFKNSKSLYNNLIEEFEDFKKEPTKSRFAMNCVINSWHLTDWTYQEFFKADPNYQDSISIDKKGVNIIITGILKYQQKVIKDCKEFEYMRLITNGTKHCILNDKSRSERTNLHKGIFSKQFSRQFNVSRFIIAVEENKSIDFQDTLVKTINYWKIFFDQTLF